MSRREIGADDETISITVGEIPKNSKSCVRVLLREFKGARLLDVRTFFLADDGSMRPTSKGICVRVDRIEALISTLAKARCQAISEGWLADEPAQRKAA